MNIFDSLKRQAFDTVTNIMGYNATWISESIIYTARVGYYDPSEKQELSGIDSWRPDEPFMEFRVDYFQGLKQRVDESNLEYITIEGIGYFSVIEVRTKYDGDTFVARLKRETP